MDLFATSFRQGRGRAALELVSSDVTGTVPANRTEVLPWSAAVQLSQGKRLSNSFNMQIIKTYTSGHPTVQAVSDSPRGITCRKTAEARSSPGTSISPTRYHHSTNVPYSSGTRRPSDAAVPSESGWVTLQPPTTHYMRFSCRRMSTRGRMGRDEIQCGKYVPTFRRELLLPSSGTTFLASLNLVRCPWPVT